MNISDLCKFINNSPTSHHAVDLLSKTLNDSGFEKISELDSWTDLQSGKHYVVRNGSLIAFSIESDPVNYGLRMLGAHTDSPSLTLKPNPVLKFKQTCLTCEIYGGPLLNTWFDRDLALAGTIVHKNFSGITTSLFNSRSPVGIIPSLAIHLDPTQNKERSVQPQKELNVILTDDIASGEFLTWLKEKSGISDILSFNLRFYDSQPVGLLGESLITGARLDNLVSCYCILEAVKNKFGNWLAVFNDHEEVGSRSLDGASGDFLQAVVSRIAGSFDNYYRLLGNSFLVSVDNAHAIHPNFADKHDSNHSPVINGGPVVKTNAKLNYATEEIGMALLRFLAEKESITLQYYTGRNDIPCGSTIGPLTSTRLGVRTMDIGIGTWGMHSIRETGGVRDIRSLIKLMSAFVSSDYEINFG